MSFDDLPRRNFLSACMAGAAAASNAQTGGSRPNILYIHSHDSGRYLQPYGHAVPAPNLQRLAEGGVLFRQAFNAAPTCSPSRASLLTGTCPHSNGMFGLAHRGFALRDYKEHLAHTLRAAGYSSALIGLQHIARDPAVIGYDQVTEVRGNHAEDVAPRAAEFLGRVHEPFFLDVGFFETHRPYRQPGSKEDGRFCLPPVPIPDTPQSRADIAAFKASARVLDDGVGVVLNALESHGLPDKTLVISTTDHGIAFPDMKCHLTDAGMGVSLIMRGPGGFSGGKVCDAMVSHLDIFPTLCELLDIEKPPRLQGTSMLPLVRGNAREIHEEIFAEVNYHAAYEPKRAVRTHGWKYIRHFDGREHPNLPNCDDGPSKTYWLDNGWRNQIVEPEQLYDLVFDPNETRNLARDPLARTALEEMRRRLDRWMHATADPLLDGPIAAPPGALANDPDGTSPNEEPKTIGRGRV
ncbi:MAG TPA: sulfatase [Bryobacteraceae bacterium]|nr:sulfatase [Bryobacteraceae bacterium]